MSICTTLTATTPLLETFIPTVKVLRDYAKEKGGGLCERKRKEAMVGVGLCVGGELVCACEEEVKVFTLVLTFKSKTFYVLLL